MKNMFLLNAPAGSGKTTYIENSVISLVEKYPNRKILCITYTNRAKDELEGRVKNKNVTIETIHTFLPSFIFPYRSKNEVLDLYFNLFKPKLEELIANGDEDSKNIKYKERYGELSLPAVRKNISKISYNEQTFSAYYYGRLSHDDIILFARAMFEKFPVLRKRLSDKYSYVFIDEYQDAASNVLHIFYQALKDTNSELYLLGDKMQEIFDNYDGSFNELLKNFDQRKNLVKNYRCQKKIVDILNNVYNDDKYRQEPNFIFENATPKFILDDFTNTENISKYNLFMQLFIFNRSRFEKIGAKEVYEAISSMNAYKFPSQYSAANVLLDKSVDNPDKLFRLLFSICDFINLYEKGSYGCAIQLVKRKKQIFNPELVVLNTHDDKLKFSCKIEELLYKYRINSITIFEFCNYLVEHGYCQNKPFTFLTESDEYNEVIKVPFEQVMTLYKYMDNPHVSTQHGVKGEGHDNVCFIAEDSNSQPITHMYSFFELFARHNINLTDFQLYYYDYNSTCKCVDLSFVAPADIFKDHKEYYINSANEIIEKYRNNLYFNFCEKETYEKFLNNPNSTNAKKCFKTTSTKGTLWAYKLFYVGCSRAKKELVILVDNSKAHSFREQLIEKMSTIGFEVE